ncbi:hypothetical protein GJ496_009528 [Pomphorhynchus laevis]|nr:hypothetical protein GJ496_009528 [Pomphorhynchus laevis]
MNSLTLTKPQKRNFRQRAHSNPYSDHFLDVSLCPDDFCIRNLYPNLQNNSSKKVTMIDIGCGYGGLLFALSKMYPEDLILGVEIRLKVQDYVVQRIHHMRQSENAFYNIASIRNNAMKFLPLMINKGQLSKLFFAFPDPHFKNKNFKRRILSLSMLPEYAYTLKIGGHLYFTTDVEEMFNWVNKQFDDCPLFKCVNVDTNKEHIKIEDAMYEQTEEAQKVTKNKGNKFFRIYERIECRVKNDDDLFTEYFLTDHQ